MEEEKVGTPSTKPASKKRPSRPTASRDAAPQIDYDKLAGMIADKMMIRVPPVSITKGLESEEFKVGQPADIVLNDGTLAVGGVSVEAVTSRDMNKTYLDSLAFMEEPVEVMVHETQDANAENPVIVGSNGIFCVFFRGVPRIAKRKFIDGLIVKSSRVSTPEFTNQAGERSYKITQQSAHKYPFNIVHDPNPKGVEWLRMRLADII